MTKIEDFKDVVMICEQKKQTGDIHTLSKMLETTTDAIRMRLSRKHEETVRALYQIIIKREELIEKFQNK